MLGLAALVLTLLLPAGAARAQPAAGNAAAEAAPLADPVAFQIRAQLGGKLKDFYRARGYWPLWVRDGTIGAEADRFIDILSTADADGLNPRRYRPDTLRDMVDRARGGPPEALARAELALSEGFANYVRDVRDVRRTSGLNIRYLDQELTPARMKETEVLRLAALAPSFPDYIEDMGWMSPFYVQLRGALGAYRMQWGDLPRTYVPDGPKLRAGSKGERVARLRERLGLPPGAAFDRDTLVAVKAFQAAHGLLADGIAGAQTMAALNRDPREYERRLALNLERARLLPGPWTRHVVVDAASARLWAYRNGRAEEEMKVVVGMPAEPTPMLAGMVRYATLNPYWNIPSDLVERRVAPRMLAGASLRSLNYEALSDWTADARILDPARIDWDAVAAGRQEVRVRQLPGRGNAMGRVKFMFPNDLGIYLHDTPDRALFAKPGRHFSSGCVRLEDAARLGRWFFGKDLLAASDAPEQHVSLPAPVPVYLVYLTAQPTAGGIAFLDDVYDRDGAPGQDFAAR